MTKQTQLVTGLLLATILAGAGCTGGATGQSPSPSSSPSPGQSDGGKTGGGSSGGGAITGKPIDPIGGNPIVGGVPPLGEPKMVLAHPGQADVHPVGVVKLEVAVSGQRAALRAMWWSGIEPCTMLDSVVVRRDRSTISITVREGSPPNAGNVACIDIALLKGTLVDLGPLEPGGYVVRTTDGDAQPVSLTIS